MTWTNYLKEAVETELNCRVLAAFNANVDNIISVTPQRLQDILIREPELIADMPHNPQSLTPIATPGHFLALLKECLALGKSYYDVVNVELGTWFAQHFPERQEAMGGQAGIIANQMAALGADAYVYNPVLSCQQAANYDQRVQFPKIENGELVWVPISAGVNDTWTKENFIFEYPKGLAYKFGDVEVVTPRANRIILGTRNPKAAMAFAEEMEPFLPQMGASVECGFMAGYHHGKVAGRAETLDQFIELSIRQKRLLCSQNPNLRLHYEYVPMNTLSEEERLLKALLPEFDSFGINENEIRTVLRCCGYQDEADEIGLRERAFSLYQGTLALFGEFGLPRIQLHNLGYYIVVLVKPYPVSPERVRRACLYASAVNAVKAKQGGAVPKEAVKSMGTVPLSELGYRQLEAFAREARENGYPITEDFLDTGIMEMDDHYMLLIPAHVVPNPVSTVGMGDTISSSAFAAEVSLSH